MKSNNSMKQSYGILVMVVLLCDAGSVLGNNWGSMIGDVKCIDKEREALLSFQQGLADPWGILSTWRDHHHNGDCCSWTGIQCNNQTGHVLELHLRGWDSHFLFGQINISALIYLQNLEYLDLSLNEFFGSQIPELIGSFVKLRYLNLSNSDFSGSIPYQLGNISRLEYLNLNDNDLVGAIPPQLGELLNLRYLNLGNNYLDGGIPYQLRNLGQLQYLNLGGESLYGAIPFHTGNLSMLHTLVLGGGFDFKIKDIEWLSNLSSLTNLDLSSLRLPNHSQHWLQMISKRIPNLRKFRLTDCSLTDNDVSTLFASQSNFSNSLTILDLSSNMLTSSTIQLLFNFSFNLQELYLSDNNLVLSSFLDIFPNFPSLVILDLSYNNLTPLILLGNFNFSSKLEELYLENCSLTDKNFLVSSASNMNSSSSLVSLDLSSNLLTSSAIFHWLFKFTANLRKLYLSFNMLEGQIPDNFDKALNSLEYLGLSGNKMQGEVPTSFGNICTLQALYLSHNNFSGDISSFIQNSTWCNRHIFHALGLSYNRITGMIPKSIRMLSELQSLYLAGNSLEGDVTDSHLNNFSKLSALDISYNSLSLKFVNEWVPPFQLIDLALASCKLGPSFPSWLHSQSHLVGVDMSNVGINDSVPDWFWNNLQYIDGKLNMSHNNFTGTIPNLSLKISHGAYIDLSSNQFEGAVPSFLLHASWLILSENKFSDLFSLVCGNFTTRSLATLTLANNQIKGQLPDCWGSLHSLMFLDLSNNDLSGRIPPSMGALVKLEALVLRNNSLIGEIPSTLKNCTNLVWLDVGENMLYGPIPPWIGQSLQRLIVLSMPGNRFFGNLPEQLCYLRKVQVLDLSRNNLSDRIPPCLQNFTTMSTKSINVTEARSQIYWFNDTYYETYGFYTSINYILNIILMWKGVESGFKDPELRLNSIDLSSNHLTGVIPKEFGHLVGLVSLNLSRNNLSGEIPFDIGNLTSLEFLDLSRNHLSGIIPAALSQIDNLGVLNLSNNSLRGRIPPGRHMDTFDASSFEGNVDLCGEQLNRSCPEDMTPIEPQGPAAHDEEDEDNSAFYEALYMSMGLGFLTGFWCFLGPILLWRSWRNAYIRFLNKLIDYVYVMVAVNMAKIIPEESLAIDVE